MLDLFVQCTLDVKLNHSVFLIFIYLRNLLMLTCQVHHHMALFQIYVHENKPPKSVLFRLQENEDVDLTGTQCVELKFAAPQEGNYEFQVICMSDCWIGCDQTIPVKVSIKKANRTNQPEAVPAPVGSDSGR